MDRFDADQCGNAPNICEAQDQEDGCLRAEVHVQPANDESWKDTKGPVPQRRHCRVGIREPDDDPRIDTVALKRITCCRPEEPSRLALSDDLGYKCNSEKARKDHDEPDNTDMQTFCGQTKQESASRKFSERGREAVENFAEEPHLENLIPCQEDRSKLTFIAVEKSWGVRSILCCPVPWRTPMRTNTQ